MEVKFKFGNTKIEISYDNLFKELINMNTQLEAMLFKNNLDFYSKLCEMMPQNMVNYYKEMTNIYEKYMGTISPSIGKIPDGPGIFPANGHDIYNYVARYGIGNYQIQAIMKLDGRLDFDKLLKAVRVSVDKEQVLGCRFIEGNPPYWRRLENIDKVMFCSFEEASDVDEAIQRFLENPLNMDTDPMVKVKLIHSDQYDTLGIKLNHACCDATGTKEYIQLLSDIYSSLDHENNMFIPVKNTRSRKDQDRLFKELGITNLDAAWVPGSDISVPTWAFPWKQGIFSTTTKFVFCRLALGQFDELKSYAKAKEATINDLILTAYYRAMNRMGRPVYGVPMQIPITIDLRRYLPDHKTEAIRNFSGSVNTWLSMVKGESFGDTLSRVGKMMNEIKNSNPGLQSAIGLERIEKISFKETLAYYQASSQVDKRMAHCKAYYGDKCVPTLSNVGILSKSLIKFDNITVNDAFIVPPVVSAPGVLMMANSYNGIMTLAAGAFEGTVFHDDMERLLNNIKNELEACK